MYRCFSGFAACVGDAAGTWGSIVLVCVCVFSVVTSVVCLLSVCYFGFLSFTLPVCGCITRDCESALFSVCILCRVGTFAGTAWCIVSVSVCAGFNLYVYV